MRDQLEGTLAPTSRPYRPIRAPVIDEDDDVDEGRNAFEGSADEVRLVVSRNHGSYRSALQHAQAVAIVWE